MIDPIVHFANLSPGLFRDWAEGGLTAALLIAATWLVSHLVAPLCGRAIGRLVSRTRTGVDDQIVQLSRGPVRALLVMIGIYLAVGALPLAPHGQQIVTGVVYVVIVFVAVRALLAVTFLVLGAYGRALHEHGRSQFERDYLPLVGKVLAVVYVALGLISVLHHFGQEVASLVAALGVGGIAVGFAAKETLGNMMAGFTILVDRPFRLGDRIRLATGETGDVIDVGTRSTRLRLLDGNMLIVPNSEFSVSRVTNFNLPSPALRAQVELGIPYAVDPERARALVLEAIRGQEGVLPEPAPAVTVSGFGALGLIVAAAFSVADYKDAGRVQDGVRVAIQRRLGEAQIRLTAPR